MAALSAVAVLAYCLLEPGRLELVERPVTVSGVAPGLAGARIVVLADLHVGAPHVSLEKLPELVRLTNAEEPDLVLLAGDYVIHGVTGGRFVEPEPIARRLSGLRAPGGVFAVLGNHDWWYDGPRVRRALEAAGIRVLENEAVVVTTQRGRLNLVGIGDFSTGHSDPRAALSDLSDSAPTVVLTHDPDVFPDLPSSVSLTIAGHTHCGQVWLPLIGRPVTPSRHGQRYACGHVTEGTKHLFVSPGIGTSILPVRFMTPPEVSLLLLR